MRRGKYNDGAEEPCRVIYQTVLKRQGGIVSLKEGETTALKALLRRRQFIFRCFRCYDRLKACPIADRGTLVLVGDAPWRSKMNREVPD